MMDNDEVISNLNTLVETCKDGEVGFRDCANHIRDAQVKMILEERARGCATAAQELQDLVRVRGGDPEKSTSFMADLHRRWVDIKASVTGNDDAMILNECERGEDVAVRSYGKVLDKPLPPEVRVVVERQYQGVLRNHDQVKSLRNQARAQSNPGH